MGKIQFDLWANEQAMLTSIICIISSAIAAAGQFIRWDCGLAAGVLSLFILVLEWPRPGREKGRVQGRPFQEPFTDFVILLGGIGRSYYARFVLYIIVSLPACVCLPTLVPAIFYFLAAMFYLVAAVRGEHWRPIINTRERRKTQFAEIQMPTRPPPRITGDTNSVMSSTRGSILSRNSFLSMLSGRKSSHKKSVYSPNPSVLSDRGRDISVLSNDRQTLTDRKSILVNRQGVLSPLAATENPPRALSMAETNRGAKSTAQRISKKVSISEGTRAVSMAEATNRGAKSTTRGVPKKVSISELPPPCPMSVADKPSRISKKVSISDLPPRAVSTANTIQENSEYRVMSITENITREMPISENPIDETSEQSTNL